MIAVVWPTAATSSLLRPLKICPTKTRAAKSSAAATRAGHEPYSTATAIADTTT
jgi:hypothetical protein